MRSRQRSCPPGELRSGSPRKAAEAKGFGKPFESPFSSSSCGTSDFFKGEKNVSDINKCSKIMSNFDFQRMLIDIHKNISPCPPFCFPFEQYQINVHLSLPKVAGVLSPRFIHCVILHFWSHPIAIQFPNIFACCLWSQLEYQLIWDMLRKAVDGCIWIWGKR